MADEFYYRFRERLGEVFCFHFLSFHPPYDFEGVNKAIAEFFENEGVTLYSCYEIFGAVDVVVGAWIPSSSVNSIEARLNSFLDTRNWAVDQVLFRVSDFPYHHLWVDTSQRIGAQNDDAPSELNGWTTAQLHATPRDELIQKNWLKTVPDNDTGMIRVFIAIPPFRGIARPQQEHLIGEISGVLREQVPKSVLYSGVAYYISLLIEAQIRIDEYPKISEFNTRINNLGLKNFGLKTTTYLTTSLSHKRTSVSFFKSAAEYMSLPESDILEVKGSISLDINRLLMTDQAEKNEVLTKEVLGTIVALLNSKGGELVIGAVEEKKFKGVVREKLQQSFSAHGDGYRVVGIESEFSFSSDQSWDGYVRRLTDFISSRIGPSYGAYLSYGQVPVEDGRSLCVVQVNPLTGQDLACLDNEFHYVRVGPSTKPLKGHELVAYLKRR
jgi:hypothetical protein